MPKKKQLKNLQKAADEARERVGKYSKEKRAELEAKAREIIALGKKLQKDSNKMINRRKSLYESLNDSLESNY